MQRAKEFAVWLAFAAVVGIVLFSGWFLFDVIRDFAKAGGR